MEAPRLIALVFAGVIALGFVATQVMVWLGMRDMPIKRRLANMLYPTSQLFLLLFAIGGSCLFSLSTMFIVLAGLFGLVGVIYDIDLFKVLIVSERKDMAIARSHQLEQQLAAQERRAEELTQEIVRARTIQKAMFDQLRQLKRHLADNDPQAARDLIAQVTQSLSPHEVHLCDNPAVDALLASKASQCAELGIPFATNVVVPVQTSIPDAELCAVFSNLIDNAMNASKELVEGEQACADKNAQEPFIEVDALIAAGYLSVRVRNACLEHRSRPHHTHKQPHSINDMHGWGKSIVALIAHRHNGSFTCVAENGVHLARVTLKM
ncbi:MAG: GHKL domain-containing protein [Coriobacteriales bacterium]|nr:GHKL domain-containing protein [Coriobacteriales bacterium]